MGSEALQGGWLAHPARWRGWQAPPRRDRDETDETDDARRLLVVASPTPADRALPGGGAFPSAPSLAPLLATATVLPPLDWAPLQALAQADASRRQALAARQEEEALLVLLLMLEEL